MADKAEKHEPLTPERHAELVAYLIRNAPGAWRVLFRPSLYLYDDKDQFNATGFENRAQDLRIRFQFETDWDDANQIIRQLISIDATLCRMSIGVSIDGRHYYGETL